MLEESRMGLWIKKFPISNFQDFCFLMVLFDNEKECYRLIILGSRRGLKTVAKSKFLLTDGTFDSSPSTSVESFYQNFVIHAEFMETGEIFPCIFCLMEHRTKENYEELYSKIKDLIRENNCPQILSPREQCIWIWNLLTNKQLPHVLVIL
jgi:hypothetical protein